MTPLPALGVDPGRSGGAVLIAADGVTALSVWGWTERKRRAGRVYELVVETPRGARRVELDSMHSIGVRLRDVVEIDHPLIPVAVEGLFVPRRRRGEGSGALGGRTAGVLTLAELTGELLGPLRLLARNGVSRPRASVWRPAVLGLARNATSEQAERTAAMLARGRLLGFDDQLDTVHVAEAYCIARYAWMTAFGVSNAVPRG